MIDDILTVIWKERKGLLGQGGSRARNLLTLLVPVLMMAIVSPVQMGPEWTSTGWSLLASIVVPLLLVGMTIPESFAGERERHTLGTLLASRLPDRAILFGKMGLAVGYGWGVTLIVLLVGLVAVNVVYWDGQVIFYKSTVVLANLGVSLLMSALVAGLGILISLRSATVRAAQQTLVGALLIPLTALQVVPLMLLSVVPDGRARLKAIVATAGSPQMIAVALAVWVAVDLALLAAVMSRFQRARLILD